MKTAMVGRGGVGGGGGEQDPRRIKYVSHFYT